MPTVGKFIMSEYPALTKGSINNSKSIEVGSVASIPAMTSVSFTTLKTSSPFSNVTPFELPNRDVRTPYQSRFSCTTNYY